MRFQTLLKKTCLTTDFRDVNNLGQPKFRTGSKNDKEQTCFLTRKTGSLIGKFLAIRKKTPESEIVFSIVNLTNKSNKSKDKYYNIGEYPEQRIQKLDKTDDRRPTQDKGRENQRNSNGRISNIPRFLSR